MRGGSIEPGWTGIGHTFDNLVTSTIAGGLRLRGNAVADNDGQISNVWTYLLHCPPSVAPSDCDETTQNGYSVFTSRILPSIVAVLAGQQVLVTVDLTFS